MTMRKYLNSYIKFKTAQNTTITLTPHKIKVEGKDLLVHPSCAFLTTMEVLNHNVSSGTIWDGSLSSEKGLVWRMNQRDGRNSPGWVRIVCRRCLDSN